mgnify:CR=1 FL=1
MANTAFNASVAYDKTSYNAGEVMTINLSGNAVFTDTVVTQSQSGSVDLVVSAENGETTHVMAPSVTISTTNNINQTLNIVLSNAVATDGRVWTILADGKKATATA